MMICSIFNWVLNMVFDIIVLKMYSVYSTFQINSRQESIKNSIRINRYITIFEITYLGFGIFLNLLCFRFLENQVKLMIVNGQDTNH